MTSCCKPALPLRSLNHISITCRSLSKSMDFYECVLGFMQVKRPDAALSCDGAWLFNYGVGVHLLKGDDLVHRRPLKKEINPQSDHLSFQSDDLGEAENRLREFGITFVKRTVSEGGISITQIFFHDPDDNMIEVCNCESLPVVPLGNCVRPMRTKSQTDSSKATLDTINDSDAEDADMNKEFKAGTQCTTNPLAPRMEMSVPVVSDMATCA
eukprot:TRINITY_DN731_c0_g1_i1.p1 TRINITY_DN731_c0_g1~~TRINITY_DN731_c0_g1_i1.p1  ORF type:complete len:212 (+),score=29.07 TRINITY_DN731_c0_g1_i1:304-939(+)